MFGWIFDPFRIWRKERTHLYSEFRHLFFLQCHLLKRPCFAHWRMWYPHQNILIKFIMKFLQIYKNITYQPYLMIFIEIYFCSLSSLESFVLPQNLRVLLSHCAKERPKERKFRTLKRYKSGKKCEKIIWLLFIG